MTNKTTDVEVKGERYQIGKLSAEVGSFVWQQIMGAMLRAAQQASVDAEQASDTKPEMSNEAKLRGICGFAFMYMDFATLSFVQKKCLRVAFYYQQAPNLSEPLPMPIIDDAGVIVYPLLRTRPDLLTMIVTEVIVDSLSCFLA